MLAWRIASLPLYATPLSAADLATLRIARTLSGPQPPANPLARLIQSSSLASATTPPHTVRAAHTAQLTRRLKRLLTLANALNRSDMRLALLTQIARIRSHSPHTAA